MPLSKAVAITMIGAKPGPYERKAIGAVDGYVLVQEIWDTTAKDCPFSPWPRGRQLPQHVGRNVVMYRKEAESLGLVARAN